MFNWTIDITQVFMSLGILWCIYQAWQIKRISKQTTSEVTRAHNKILNIEQSTEILLKKYPSENDKKKSRA